MGLCRRAAGHTTKSKPALALRSVVANLPDAAVAQSTPVAAFVYCSTLLADVGLVQRNSPPATLSSLGHPARPTPAHAIGEGARAARPAIRWLSDLKATGRVRIVGSPLWNEAWVVGRRGFICKRCLLDAQRVPSWRAACTQLVPCSRPSRVWPEREV